ncbi:MAG TPA: SIMPL domain-containing protein [Thermomicrobiaceae bacterium]|nr:SIMPL domain-containing protein [Thermomicrobiaceae bacterium]
MSAAEAAQRSISVSGQGTVTVAPDTAQATLGVQIQDRELARAQGEAARIMGDVQNALKAAGVPEAKIKTMMYNVQIDRNFEDPAQPITGYTVVDLVQVSMTPVSQLGAVLQAAIAAGANMVQGVGFTVADTSAAEQQARQQAMADARAKAEQLAQLAGVTLGQPLEISEGGTILPATPATGSFRSFSLKASAAIPPPMQAGESTIGVGVTVRYSIS